MLWGTVECGAMGNCSVMVIWGTVECMWCTCYGERWDHKLCGIDHNHCSGEQTISLFWGTEGP